MELGFKSMGQDPCVFKCAPFKDQPPVCLGMHADDFVCFSESNKVEEWFEQIPGSKLTVDFMGTVLWFLGCQHDWHRLEDGRLTCHISQQAFVEQLCEKHGMSESTVSRQLFKQGLPINRIKRNDGPIDPVFAKRHQSLMGGPIWPVCSTQPDINVAAKLLGQFNQNLSEGHMDSARCVLQHLKGTASHGIWFTQGDTRLHGNVAFPPTLDPNHLTLFTDSNWGSQDASRPRENETRTVNLDGEMNSPQGHHVACMGGAIVWGVVKEQRVSRSLCEAQIEAMDKGTKGMQFFCPFISKYLLFEHL